MDYADWSEFEYLQAKLMQHMAIKTQEDLDKLRTHKSTKVIKYPDFKEPFDYVHECFPGLDVKSITILEVERELLEKLGYKGVGGLYSSLWKTIVMTDTQDVPKPKRKMAVQAKITKDEVVTHELLHYCSDLQGKTNTSADIEEEFAYGWCYGYLKRKGYTDDEIIGNNYLPYLVSTTDQQKVLCDVFKSKNISLQDFMTMPSTEKKKLLSKIRQPMHDRMLELARERGWQIIRIYAKKLRLEPDAKQEAQTEANRFDLMDV